MTSLIELRGCRHRNGGTQYFISTYSLDGLRILMQSETDPTMSQRGSRVLLKTFPNDKACLNLLVTAEENYWRSWAASFQNDVFAAVTSPELRPDKANRAIYHRYNDNVRVCRLPDDSDTTVSEIIE